MILATEQHLAAKVRADFPILQDNINGNPLVYLDNASTSQKPLQVLKTWQNYYEHTNANAHRGIHTLSSQATEAYENARQKIATFVNATSAQEIVYTRNATEGINLVASTWGGKNLEPGDEIILSVMEHHSNLIPWQQIAQRTGAVLKFVELTDTQEFNWEQFKSLLSNRTKLVSVVHISNTLGCINPIQDITALAHHYGAKVLIDACQSTPHLKLDVQAIDCDWLAASGHKMCAPTGIGFLYGKLEVLREMPPFLGGGKMIAEVFLDHATYADIPYRFEAGTPATGEAIALGAAVDYLTAIGMDKIQAYEHQLTAYLFEQLKTIPSLNLYGPQPNTDGSGRAALASFSCGTINPYQLAQVLDQAGIAIRAGQYCTQPLHRILGVPCTARVSPYFYNTREEIDAFISALQEAIPFVIALQCQAR